MMTRNKNNTSTNLQKENLEEEDNIKNKDEEIKKREISYCVFFINKTHLFAIYIGNFVIKIIKISMSLYGIYLVWIILHFCASHLYVKLCVPASFLGLVVSPFLTTTPHCQGLRWIIYNGANTINNMWIVIGTWLSSNLLFFTRNMSQENV
jgi:hypothetical protein